jgi:alkylresorcinol/alkylpyrone synthase
MNDQPRIASIATAVPPFLLRQEDVLPAAASHFTGANPRFERLMPIYRNAQIDTRYSCVPLEWYGQDHGFAERNELYLENAVELLTQAAREAVEMAGLTLADIDGIVVVSSTGIATPSLDALVMERLDLRRDIMRLPIFGLGCVGGVLGLARTAALARAEPGLRILFLVVELCGLTFRANDFTKSNIVATALFGDGAAAAVVTSECDGPRVTAWGEHTWKDTLGIMGWGVRDDGLAVVFSRDIPMLVRTQMGEAAESFLDRVGLGFADIGSFVCHPGGAKVLDALEEIFGLAEGALTHSREVLRSHGNMSAATVLFVLKSTLESGDPAPHLLSSLGPGFTAGFLVLDGKE